MSSAKRALFQTPTRASKRAKSTKKAVVMKIPKSLLPETKQYRKQGLTSLISVNEALSSIPVDMTQGDDGTHFVGSKFRVQRIRVFYDFSAALTSIQYGIRLSVVIPKIAAQIPTLTSRSENWNTAEYTVLHDLFIPNDLSVRTGTFDVIGPINVHMDNTGGVCHRNNIHILAHSTGAGAELQTGSALSYAVWFTDA